MRKSLKNRSNASRLRIFFAFVHALIFFTGIFMLRFDYNSNVKDAEEKARDIAIAASSALDLNNLRSLKVEESDMNTDAYRSLKKGLERFSFENKPIRFAYIYTLRDEKLLILVDSEDVSSPDFAKPGTEFLEAHDAFYSPFSRKCNDAMVTTVINDRWGVWKSVLVPICDSENKEIIAVFGVDYPLDQWYSPILMKTSQTFFLILVSIIAAVMLSLLFKNNLLLKEKQFQLVLSTEEAKIERSTALEAQSKTLMYSSFQQVLLEISADFVPTNSNNIRPTVDKAFERMGETVGADRIYLYVYDFDSETLNYSAGWSAPAIVAVDDDINNISFALVGDLPSIHSNGNLAFFTQEEDIADDKSGIKDFANLRNASCVLTLPIIVEGKCYGFIGIDSLRPGKRCDEYHMRLLTQFSNLLSATLDRVRLIDALSESEEKYRNIFEFAPVGILNFDINTVIVDCNDILADILGAPREQILGLEIRKLPNPMANQYIQKVLSGEACEFRGIYTTFSNNKEVTLLGKFAPILSGSGEVVAGIGFIEDISERKKLGDELRLKSLVLDQLEEHITITDMQGKITYVNRIQTENRHFGSKTLLGESTEVFGEDPSRGPTQKEVLEKTLRDGFWHGEIINYAADGSEIIMDCKTQIVTDDEGKPVALGGIAQNITDRKLMEQVLYREKEQFRTTLLSVGDGVISTDGKGIITIVNTVAKKLLGLKGVDIVGHHISDVFRLIDDATGEPIIGSVEKILAGEKAREVPVHAILLSADGTGIYIEETTAPIKDRAGNTTGVVLVFRDFTEKHLRQKEIEFLSFHDYLTGLHNRRYYEENVKLLDKEDYLPLTIIMADVNGLKLTNDAFGHAVGDLLLRRIARILRKASRSADLVARIGGDEFILVLPKSGPEVAEKVMARINAAIAKEKVENLVLSISMGYAVKSDEAMSLEDLFTGAENAMYRHKLTESSSMRSRTIDMIMTSLFEKSEREMYHSKRVGELSEAIAAQMGFSATQVNQIMLAGLMHDIGKIGVNEDVLNKTSKLDENERKIIERHCETGYRILSSASEFGPIAQYILEHHERPDGKGYPRGLKGDEISMPAKIIAVADAYDAMMSDRPYRKAMKKEDAINELLKYSKTQFDGDVVETLVKKVLKFTDI